MCVADSLELLHLLSVGVLDLDPGRVIVLRLQKRDLGGDVIRVHISLIVNVKLLKVLSEFLCSWLANGLGLLH